MATISMSVQWNVKRVVVNVEGVVEGEKGLGEVKYRRQINVLHSYSDVEKMDMFIFEYMQKEDNQSSQQCCQLWARGAPDVELNDQVRESTFG